MDRLNLKEKEADTTLIAAMRVWLNTTGHTELEHLISTPERFVRALRLSVNGYTDTPAESLRRKFINKTYSEMVIIQNIRIVTRCAHHLERIIGRAHFAYIPDKHVVGLSKVPRMIRILTNRLQIQEALTDEIVDCFQETVQPKGCAVQIRAYHMCMMARGVFEPDSATITNALRGCFLDDFDVRSEFLSSLPKNGILV